ncbi:MAG: DUF4926 domain-containing protein [Bryobacterales bacterium]|nr:DUF4926 domain-containing protein [Bryobacterales bacterium]
MPELELLSVVALLEDIRDQPLLRGQVGTVVERLAPGVYEVEFSDDEGRTYASVAVRGDCGLWIFMGFVSEKTHLRPKRSSVAFNKAGE